MRDCQVNAVVHANDTLERSKLDAVILLRRLDIFGNLVGSSQVDGIVFFVGFEINEIAGRARTEQFINIHLFLGC